MASCRAVLSCEVDDLEMEFIPFFFRKQAFEIGLCLLDGFCFAKSPAGGAAVDVCVDGEGRMMEGLRHDNRGGLVADAREIFERFKGIGDLGLVFVEELFG